MLDVFLWYIKKSCFLTGIELGAIYKSGWCLHHAVIVVLLEILK